MNRKEVSDLIIQRNVIQTGRVLIFGMVRITKTPTIRISDLESISFDYVTIDQNCTSQRIRRAEGTAEEVRFAL